MENQIEIMEVQSVTVTEAQSRAEIDIQVATANRFPRNVDRAVQNVIAIVSRDKKLAEKCVYSLPRAGKEIQGASVHLARLIASEYKNIRVDSRIVEIGDTMVTAQSTVMDLQNNYAIRTEVKRRITDKKGQRFADDMIVVTCNAALSIASRNAILQVIPASVVNQIYESAQKAITGDLTDEQKLLKRRQEILDGYLKTWNVTEAEILTMLGIETVNQIKQNEMLTLVGLANAIHDGDTTINEAFGRTAQNGISINTKEKVAEAIAKARERKSKQASVPKEQPKEEPKSNGTLKME
jgi:hypothetical protein